MGLPLLAAAPQPTLLQILSAELQRNFTVLKQKADPAPYFLAYEVTETESDSISASSGTLSGVNHSHRRQLDVTLRVGTPKLDNYHVVGGRRAEFTSGALLALDNVPDPIRHIVQRKQSAGGELSAPAANHVVVVELGSSDPQRDIQLTPVGVIDATQ